jgi:hypothetical protein
MTPAELKASAERDATPPPSLNAAARALWHAHAGQWDAAHNIAQDDHSSLGSWTHALLHLMEGDVGNAGYWFTRAGRPAVPRNQIAAEWDKIAAAALTSP